jgi:hypothetical protein
VNLISLSKTRVNLSKSGDVVIVIIGQVELLHSLDEVDESRIAADKVVVEAAERLREEYPEWRSLINQ